MRGASSEGEEEETKKNGGGGRGHSCYATDNCFFCVCYVTASDLFFFHQSEMNKVLNPQKREPRLFSIAKCFFFFKPERV